MPAPGYDCARLPSEESRTVFMTARAAGYEASLWRRRRAITSEAPPMPMLPEQRVIFSSLRVLMVRNPDRQRRAGPMGRLALTFA